MPGDKEPVFISVRALKFLFPSCPSGGRKIDGLLAGCRDVVSHDSWAGDADERGLEED